MATPQASLRATACRGRLLAIDKRGSAHRDETSSAAMTGATVCTAGRETTAGAALGAKAREDERSASIARRAKARSEIVARPQLISTCWWARK